MIYCKGFAEFLQNYDEKKRLPDDFPEQRKNNRQWKENG